MGAAHFPRAEQKCPAFVSSVKKDQDIFALVRRDTGIKQGRDEGLESHRNSG